MIIIIMNIINYLFINEQRNLYLRLNSFFFKQEMLQNVLPLIIIIFFSFIFKISCCCYLNNTMECTLLFNNS